MHKGRFLNTQLRNAGYMLVIGFDLYYIIFLFYFVSITNMF